MNTSTKTDPNQVTITGKIINPKGESVAFSNQASLISNGGDPFSGYYWSSTECNEYNGNGINNSANWAYCIPQMPQLTACNSNTATKNSGLKTRAIRQF